MAVSPTNSLTFGKSPSQGCSDDKKQHGGESVEMHSTQRLDPTVREIAARTQVQIQRLKQCPECSESLDDGFHILDVRPTVVKYECQSCEETDLIWSENAGQSGVTAAEIFQEALNQ